MNRGDLSPIAESSAQRTSAAFAAAAYALGVEFVGSNLPTPLYPVYEARWHFSAGIVTVIFASYSLGLIAALVGVGRVSDQLGRHRLRAVFLAALGADKTQIEASFCEAIRIAREQKSISLQKRAEATYAEYRWQKACSSRVRGIRLQA